MTLMAKYVFNTCLCMFLCIVKQKQLIKNKSTNEEAIESTLHKFL